MRLTLAFLGATCVSIAGCAAGLAAPRPELRAEVEAAEAEFVALLKSGRPAEVASLYTEDGMLVQNEARGRAAIAKVFAPLGPLIRDARIVVDEVEARGDTAWETGTAYITLALPGGEVVQRHRHLHVWKRGPDGKLRLHRAMVAPAPSKE